MATGGRRLDRVGDVASTHRPVEIRFLIPEDPFAGLTPRFGDDTKVLFVVEGPKAVAVRRNISVRTLYRQFREGGRTFSGVRQECRANLVATLFERGVPVRAVARAIGLSGPQALGRFVLSRFGLTPARLRDELTRRGLDSPRCRCDGGPVVFCSLCRATSVK